MTDKRTNKPNTLKVEERNPNFNFKPVINKPTIINKTGFSGNSNSNYGNTGNNNRMNNKGIEDSRPVNKLVKSSNLMNQQINNLVTFPCKFCERRFVEESLAKHEKNCKRVFFSKRKAFDPQKHRIIDSEYAMLIKFSKKNEKFYSSQQHKRNWKQESEEWRSGLKDARAHEQMSNINTSKSNYGSKYSTGSKTSNSYNSNSKSTSNVGTLKTCYYCNRSFPASSLLKHVSFCEYREKGLNIKKLFPGGKKSNHSSYSQKVQNNLDNNQSQKLYTNSNSSLSKNNNMNNMNSLNNNMNSMNVNSKNTGMGMNSMNMKGMGGGMGGGMGMSNDSNSKYKIINSNTSSLKW